MRPQRTSAGAFEEVLVTVGVWKHHWGSSSYEGPHCMLWRGMWPGLTLLVVICYPTAAMMIIHLIGGCTIVDTAAATGAMTTAGTEERPIMTQIFGIPMNTIERTAVTEASAAAEGNTEGEEGGAGHSAVHLQ